MATMNTFEDVLIAVSEILGTEPDTNMLQRAYIMACAMCRGYAPNLKDEELAGDVLTNAVIVPLSIRIMNDDFSYSNSTTSKVETVSSTFTRYDTNMLQPFKPFLDMYRKIKIV